MLLQFAIDFIIVYLILQVYNHIILKDYYYYKWKRSIITTDGVTTTTNCRFYYNIFNY